MATSSKSTMLELVAHHAVAEITKQSLEFTPDLSWYIHSLSGSLILELQKKIWAEKKEHIVDASYYIHDSWWQLFKWQYFPKWLLRWFPIKMGFVERKFKVSFYKKFPDFNYAPHRDYGRSVPFMDSQEIINSYKNSNENSISRY